MAGRLSAAGHTVLLVEAGGSAPVLVHVPGLVANLQRGVLDLYLAFFTFAFLKGFLNYIWPINGI